MPKIAQPLVDAALGVVTGLWEKSLELGSVGIGLARLAFDAGSGICGWVGFGFGGSGDDRYLALFVREDADHSLLRIVLEPVLLFGGAVVPTRYIQVDGFRQLSAPPQRAAATEIRPGAPVMTVSPRCTTPEVGAIGAIVTRRAAQSERWILSCNHVMASKCRFASRTAVDRGFAVCLDDSDQTRISTTIHTRDITPNGNPFDACVAKVDSTRVEADYRPLTLTSGTPIRPAEQEIVEKCGPASRTTRGRVAVSNGRVLINLPASGVLGAEMIDQVLVSTDSLIGGPFSAEGDSGSLVVHPATGRPVGIVSGVGVGVTDQVQYTVISPMQAILDGVGGADGPFDLVLT